MPNFKLSSFLLFVLVLFFCLGAAQAQDNKAAIKGVITDKSGQPLAGATVRAVHEPSGTPFGISSDVTGAYILANIFAGGPYTLKVTFVGYKTQTLANITLADDETKTIDFSLAEEAIQAGEVIVEVNRAKQRETPVAFSDVGSKEINKQMHSQDAPLLVRTIPGLYSYSTDGVGNGESKVFVRGFDQNRVQVLINGIPTNDPESNAVYWSNWGAVSSAAASVQVQRGAGSSLYGSGSFGGSFNVITSEVAPGSSLQAHGSFGSPELGVYGVTAQSGLIKNFIAASLLYDWKTGRGTREGAYYQGANYYAAIAMYPDAKTSVKVLIHGGPQEHGYSYNAPIAYFKKYGYSANPAYFLPINVLSQMVGAKTLEDSMHLAGDSRLLRDSKYLTLSHNFYHKPQMELHIARDINENNSVQGTFFYSVGRGGGSSLSGTSSLSQATFGGDTTGYYLGTSAYQNLDPGNGVIKSDAAAATFIAKRFLSSAYQRISYSLHRQWGIIGSWDTKINEQLKLTIGGEYRDWFADHPGYYTNLFGKSSLTVQSYGYRANGTLSVAGTTPRTFTRRTYQGDMAEFGGSDKLDVNYINPFMGYTLGTGTPNGTYNDQYRNYVGETKQGTLFVQGNYKLLPSLTILGSLQYAFYNYHIYENMPSESAIADSVAAPANPVEGLQDGFFYMKSSAATSTWYKFNLVDITRDRNFFQPKLGFNFNLTETFNVFANISHVERMLDLSVLYNAGNPNPSADDEKSNQYEAGVGFKNDILDARVNAYYMTWENKTATITDQSKMGFPGYDRNGNKWDLIGSSTNQGIEMQASLQLDKILPIKGFTLNASLTLMDNKWTKVLDAVKIDPTKGTLQEDLNLNGKLDPGEDQNGNAKLDENRRVFDNGALSLTKTAAGADTAVLDYLYYSELENTVNASTPFTNITYGITYETAKWFVGLSAMTSLDFYALDGGSYIPVEGYFDASFAVPRFIVTKWDNKLPVSTVVDLQAGYRLDFAPLHVLVTGQVLNVLDAQFLVAANRSGVLPGVSRSYRLNVSVGI